MTTPEERLRALDRSPGQAQPPIDRATIFARARRQTLLHLASVGAAGAVISVVVGIGAVAVRDRLATDPTTTPSTTPSTSTPPSSVTPTSSKPSTTQGTKVFTGELIANGPTVTLPFAAPDQQWRLRLVPPPGQIVTIRTTGATPLGFRVTLLDPQGNSVAEDALDHIGPLDAVDHTVVVEPDDGTTGSVTLQAFAYTDLMSKVAVGGDPAKLVFEVPFQQARVAFSPPAGRTITIAAESAADFRLVLLGPAGVELETATSSGSPSLRTVTLTNVGPLDPGNYTIVVDPISEKFLADVVVSATFYAK